MENRDYSIETIKNLFPEKKVRFFYSAAYLFEAECFPENAMVSKNDFLQRRFKTIRSVFKNNYLYLNLKGNVLTHLMEDPKEVYDTITGVPLGIEGLKGFTAMFSKEQKDHVREQIGIDLRKINNYRASEVIDHLNTKLTLWGDRFSFLELIENAIRLHPDGQTFGFHNRIGGVFELLDMFGYWKDKETSTSEYARLWDADHCFCATYCDYFISDDKKARNKAAVIYHTYDKRTKIMSSKGEA